MKLKKLLKKLGKKVTPATKKVAKERWEQIHKHGFLIQNDQFYRNGELVQAALFCVSPDNPLFYWPVKWDKTFKDKILKKNLKQRMVIAAAFLTAESDRLIYFVESKPEEVRMVNITKTDNSLPEVDNCESSQRFPKTPFWNTLYDRYKQNQIPDLVLLKDWRNDKGTNFSKGYRYKVITYSFNLLRELLGKGILDLSEEFPDTVKGDFIKDFGKINFE